MLLLDAAPMLTLFTLLQSQAVTVKLLMLYPLDIDKKDKKNILARAVSTKDESLSTQKITNPN